VRGGRNTRSRRPGCARTGVESPARAAALPAHSASPAAHGPHRPHGITEARCRAHRRALISGTSATRRSRRARCRSGDWSPRTWCRQLLGESPTSQLRHWAKIPVEQLLGRGQVFSLPCNRLLVMHEPCKEDVADAVHPLLARRHAAPTRPLRRALTSRPSRGGDNYTAPTHSGDPHGGGAAH